jgi:hypothetical protein
MKLTEISDTSPSAKLIVIKGGAIQREVVLDEGRDLRIGRDRNNDLVLDDP